MNLVIISGRMVRDADVRYVANDNMAVVRFTLAIDKNYKKSLPIRDQKNILRESHRQSPYQ